MHANTAVLILALTAVTPALSAPLSLGTLAKEAGKGLVTGAGLAGVVDGVESLVGGSSSSKRELSAEDIALLKRAVGLSSLAKEIGKGLVTGAGLAGVVDGVESLVGGSSSSKRAIITTSEGPCAEIDGHVACPAVTGPVNELSTRSLLSDIENALKNAGSIVDGIVKREPLLPCSDFGAFGPGDGLGPACTTSSTSSILVRSLLSKILPAAEEGVDDILKKAVAGGAAAGVGGAAVDAATGSSSSKRELTDEQLLALMFAGGNDGVEKREPLSLGPVGKLLTGAAASIATSSVVEDAINAVTGQSSKREMKRTPTGPCTDFGGIEACTLIPANVNRPAASLIDTRSLLSDIENGADDVLKKAESVVGGIVKREINARSLLGDIENDAGDVLKKAESVIGGIVKREINTRSLLSDIENGADDVLKKAESVVSGIVKRDNSKREPVFICPTPPLKGIGLGPSCIPASEASNLLLSTRSVLSKLLPAAEEGVDDILKKAVAGGAAAGVAGAAVDTAAGTTSSKREPLFPGDGNVPTNIGVEPNGVIDPISLNDLD